MSDKITHHELNERLAGAVASEMRERSHAYLCDSQIAFYVSTVASMLKHRGHDKHLSTAANVVRDAMDKAGILTEQEAADAARAIVTISREGISA